jgi:hypothetical protein
MVEKIEREYSYGMNKILELDKFEDNLRFVNILNILRPTNENDIQKRCIGAKDSLNFGETLINAHRCGNKTESEKIFDMEADKARRRAEDQGLRPLAAVTDGAQARAAVRPEIERRTAAEIERRKAADIAEGAAAKTASTAGTTLIDTFLASIDEEIIVKQFETADKDSSGTLGEEEMKVILKKIDPSATDEQIKAVVEALDRTKDGNIDLNELLQVVVSRKRRADGRQQKRAELPDRRAALADKRAELTRKKAETAKARTATQRPNLDALARIYATMTEEEKAEAAARADLEDRRAQLDKRQQKNKIGGGYNKTKKINKRKYHNKNKSEKTIKKRKRIPRKIRSN